MNTLPSNTCDSASAPSSRLVITSICMNRNAFLRVAVEKWLPFGVPIVVVDWSSTEPVRETLRHFLDRVTVVEIPGKPYFDLSKSKNACWRAAKRLHPDLTHILNFDCDVHAHEPARFLKRYPLTANSFYSGGVHMRRVPVENATGDELRRLKEIHRNRWATYGTFLAPFALLEAVNMNDERMEGYGMFDVDLYQRLQAHGALWHRIRFYDLFHQFHEDRTAHYAEKDLDASMAKNKEIMQAPARWSHAFEPERQQAWIDGECILL